MRNPSPACELEYALAVPKISYLYHRLLAALPMRLCHSARLQARRLNAALRPIVKEVEPDDIFCGGNLLLRRKLVLDDFHDHAFDLNFGEVGLAVFRHAVQSGQFQ